MTVAITIKHIEFQKTDETGTIASGIFTVSRAANQPSALVSTFELRVRAEAAYGEQTTIVGLLWAEVHKVINEVTAWHERHMPTR